MMSNDQNMLSNESEVADELEFTDGKYLSLAYETNNYISLSSNYDIFVLLNPYLIFNFR